MLSRENNEALVRVGPGTDMGTVMRRYWHPVATSAQLPRPDCKPLRARLLGENFVVFRNTAGQIGMLDELCMHRGASLALGRVEDGAIRCLYHGWKFAVDGTILETPNHADCRFREKNKAKAYPVVEKNGLIWAYIGPKEAQPPFRVFASDEVPEANRVVARINVKANYLQLWEGGLDSSHVTTLHTNQARPSWNAERGIESNGTKWTPMEDPSPVFACEDTSFGFHYAATRKVREGETWGNMRHVRVTAALFPTGRIIRGPNLDVLVWETPADDFSTSTYLTAYSADPLDKNYFYGILGLDDPRVWSESDPNWKGSWENDFFQDRSTMDQSWTGLRGIEQEDAAIGLSPGPIYDRSQEHLVTADMAVVYVRRRLLENIKLVKSGQPAIGCMISDLRSVASPEATVRERTDWREIATCNRELAVA